MYKIVILLIFLVKVRGLLQYKIICKSKIWKNDLYSIAERTAAGGFAHTVESRAKIGAANKGKVPWNKGRERTAEERARISEGVKARNRVVFLKKLEGMNMTEEEYLNDKKEKKRLVEAERRRRRTANGGYIPTDETKAKISRILKEKYASGEIKRSPFAGGAGMKNRTHSIETRNRISESLRQKWKDHTYRDNMKTKVKTTNSKSDVRKRISETLKKKWQDPAFRQYMLDKMAARALNSPHSPSHRQKISDTMKRKWQDAQYRQNAIKGMAKVQRPLKQLNRTQVNAKITKTIKLKYQSLNSTKTPTKPKLKTIPKTPTKPLPQVIIPHTTAQSLGIDLKEDQKRITRLRHERRDLYDLLYGDEEDDFDAEDFEEFVKMEDIWSVVT